MTYDTQSSAQFLNFELDGEQFAFNVLITREVLSLEHITPLPNAAEFLAGVINLRGSVVPVIDLRKKFKLHERPFGEDTSIIIVEINLDGETTIMGVLVDLVHGVIRCQTSDMEAPPKFGMKLNSALVKSIAKRNDTFIVVLDNEKLLSEDELWLMKKNNESQETSLEVQP